MSRLTISENALAALWFAAFAFFGTTTFFLPLRLAFRGEILYVILPTVAGGVAGYISGAAILDSARVVTVQAALWRGIMTAGTAYGIFAVLFAIAVPPLETGWSFSQTGGLFLLTVSLGLLMGGPLALILGITAGASLYKFSRNWRSRTKS